MHPETLRRWMLAAGLWSRARRRAGTGSGGSGEEHFGELVQMDGSFHEWFEQRGPKGCLMNMVDDATGTTLGRIGKEETIWTAAGVLRRWIEGYGVPLALYTDWKNLYKRPTEQQSARRGEHDAVWADVRTVGNPDHRGEFAAGERPGGAQPRHAPGPAGEEVAARK